jgi:type I restriction enzyme M protein
VPNYYDFELITHVKKQENHLDFEFVSLGDLEKKGHLSIRNVPSSTSKQAYGSGEIPFIRTTDIANGEIIYPATHSVSKEVFEEYKDKQGLKEFDILFVKDGTYRIGASALLFENDLNSLIQSHFKIIRVERTDLINPFLLFYLLQQKIVQRQIDNNIFTQATLSSIGNRIYNIKLPIPREETERIRLTAHAKEALTIRNKYKHEFFNSKLSFS